MRKTWRVFMLFLFVTGLVLGGCRERDTQPTPFEATPAPTPTPAIEGLAEISAYIQDLAAKDQFSGAVLIAKDGAPVFEVTYGLADRANEVPNRVDTKFNVGSINKMFTAVAILQLLERDQLSLDDRIIDFMPGYPNEEVAHKVTVHHLLTHTSGMGEVFGPEFSRTSKDRFKDVRDYLPLFMDAPLQFEPGTQSSYSNAGFIVLGLIIEKASGQNYFDYVMENIYQPSGMINTDAYELDYPTSNLAVGYTQQGAEPGRVKNNYYIMLRQRQPRRRRLLDRGGFAPIQQRLAGK